MNPDLTPETMLFPLHRRLTPNPYPSPERPHPDSALPQGTTLLLSSSGSAERVDRSSCLDAHKLDISDEFSEVIKALKNHEDKMVLNKADQIETQQLSVSVAGALMWSLGKEDQPTRPR